MSEVRLRHGLTGRAHPSLAVPGALASRGGWVQLELLPRGWREVPSPTYLVVVVATRLRPAALR